MPCISRHHFGAFVLASLNFSIKLLFILSPKWKSSWKKGIEEDTQCPHVHLASIVLTLPHKFWGHVRWSSTKDFEFLIICAKSSKSEIDNFDHKSFILDQDIIQLNVSVSNTFLMEVIKGLRNLFEESSAHWLFHLAVGALLLDVLVQTNAANIIGYDANCLWSFNQIMHLDNVRVINLFQSKNLSLNSLSFHWII